MKKNLTFFGVLISIILSACLNEKIVIEPEEPEPVDTTITDTTDTTSTFIACSYNDVIKPIIEQNCAVSGCHVSGFGSGDFSTYNGLKAKIENSGPFETRVLINQDMPPSNPLSQADRDSIQCWLDAGFQNN